MVSARQYVVVIGRRHRWCYTGSDLVSRKPLMMSIVLTKSKLNESFWMGSDLRCRRTGCVRGSGRLRCRCN